MKPSASAEIGSEVSGNVLRIRRPSSRGVSPGRRSAPASRASASVRFQTAMTLRGRKYLEMTTSNKSSRAMKPPRILVAVDASRTEETLMPAIDGPLAGSLRSPRALPGVDPPPTGNVTPPVGSWQLLSRRHVAWGPAPRGIGVDWVRLAGVGPRRVPPDLWVGTPD